MNWYTKTRERQRHRKRRKYNAHYKEVDRLRCANYQRRIDKIQKTRKRKAEGRALKVKGMTMPTQLCANSHTAKSWKHLNGKPMRGESMKVRIIWDLT